jgi:tetratricopeptide (TPR) repeat protein/transcriptional regulator with XRE-family HTH domain
VPFGVLLRALRVDAGLTQQKLAEAAQLSYRSISDLERGINLSPRRETARLLADALGLAGPERQAFEAAARTRLGPGSFSGSAPPGSVAVATRMLPRDIASFTGREPELRQLMSAVAGADSGAVFGICTIGGMAGIGKTAFVVHAAHQLTGRFPDGQIFLPLHGHTPGQRPVDPATALASLLQAAGVPARQIPAGLEPRAWLWRDHLAGKRLLLVLDDAAGHDQVRPLLPGAAGTLVLITSRRHLTALEDTLAISLDVLPPSDAAALLVRLAIRPGLAAGDSAVQKIIQLCGYLPLAIGMLARQLHHHPVWTVLGLAADLAAARDRLELMRAENLSIAAAFGLSYQDLTKGQQRLFRRLGLHPGIDIDGYAAAALDDTDLDTARRHLNGLYDQYLLSEPTRGRYQLHDLLREHARSLAEGDPRADQHAAIERLLAYYLCTAQKADRYLARRASAESPAGTVTPRTQMPHLTARDEAVAWMESERPNLNAAVTYAAAHDLPGYATAIPAAMHGFMRSLGHWNQAQALHLLALRAARLAGDDLAEAGALIDLGNYQLDTGHTTPAISSYQDALDLYRYLDNELGQANALNHLGNAQRAAGDLQAAAVSHQRALELHHNLGNSLGEAHAHRWLGALSQQVGDYNTAATRYDTALQLFRNVSNPDCEGEILNHIGRLAHISGIPQHAMACYQEAMAIADRTRSLPIKATTCENLGHLHLDTGDTTLGTNYLMQALDIFQKLGSAHAEKIQNTIDSISATRPQPTGRQDP